MYRRHFRGGRDCFEMFPLQSAIHNDTNLPRIASRSNDNWSMESALTVLIVDDDREIRLLLAEYLNVNGYRAVVAEDGGAMEREMDRLRIDLIVLDLNMPGEDGLALCRKLRVRSTIPVIMLTARSEPVDRILGLEMGADDYLSKPFEPRELLARIRSVLRRSHSTQDAFNDASATQQLHFAGWTLDLTARHLIDPDGTVVMLSGAEFRLLKVFLDRPNRVLNRDQILNHTHGRDADPFDRSIDIQISRLRQKLKEDARSPQIIKTVRNGGYVLAVPVTAGTVP